MTWTAQTVLPAQGYWFSVASSSGGTHLVAVAYGGSIYTAAAVTATAQGGQGSSEQFQYLGNGVWQPLQATGTWSVSGNNLYYNTGNVGIGTSSPTTPLEVNGTITCVSLTQTSDRNAKENFTPLDARTVLAKVASLPLTQWNFKKESKEVQHIGPMAQDFHAAFGLDGNDDKHISVVDEGGVALAAIQGLNEKLNEKDAEIQELKQSVADLKKLVQSLAEKK